MKKGRIYWTKQDDSVLIKLIQKSLKDNFYIKWIDLELKLLTLYEKGIVSHKYTKIQCVKRWFNHLKDKKVEPEWSNRDSYKLIILSKEYGLNWKLITNQFVNRTESQIFEKYQELYEKKVFFLLRKNRLELQNYKNMSTSTFTALISSVPYLELTSEVIKNTFLGYKKVNINEIKSYLIGSYSFNIEKSNPSSN